MNDPLKGKLEKVFQEVWDMHPYKQKGNLESFDKYNEGWSDACDILEQRILKLFLEDNWLEVDSINNYLDDNGRISDILIKVKYKNIESIAPALFEKNNFIYLESMSTVGCDFEIIGWKKYD